MNICNMLMVKNVTFKWFSFFMNWCNMLINWKLSWTFLLTKFTFEWLISFMNWNNISFHVYLLRAAIVTNVTFVWFLSLMNGIIMFLDFDLLRKAFATYFTSKSLLSFMHWWKMPFLAWISREMRITYFTFEGSCYGIFHFELICVFLQSHHQRFYLRIIWLLWKNLILGSGFDWRRRRKGCQETVSISGTIQRTNRFLRRAPWTNERHWKYENFATLVPLWHETIQTIIAEQYQKVRKITEILIRDRPFRKSAIFKDFSTPLSAFFTKYYCLSANFNEIWSNCGRPKWMVS